MTRRDPRQFRRPAAGSDRTLTPVPKDSNCPTVPATLLSLVNPSFGGSGVKTADRTLMSHSD
jgi:hypothetical protein